MDSFIFSLNATIPIFIVIVIGYVLKQIGMLNDEFLSITNKFNFRVTLPALLFLDLAKTDFAHSFNGKYVLFCFFATLCSIVLIWGLAKVFLKDKSLIGEFVQASYRSSAAVLGIAFVVNICGDSGMAPLMIVGAVPLYNIFAVLILTFEGNHQKEGKGKLKKALIGILTNPILDAIALGFLYSILKLPMPQILNSSLDNLGRMATPLALICIGGGFEGRKAIKMIKETLAASIIKLVIQPLLFLPVAVWLGFRGDLLVATIIMTGSPTTPSSYIMAKNMGHEGTLTSSTVMLTTLFSAFTLTGWLYLLKTLALI